RPGAQRVRRERVGPSGRVRGLLVARRETMKKVRTCLLSALFLAGLGLVVTPAQAADDFKVGVRVSYFTDVGEAAVGGEVLALVAHRFWFNPNVEYVFVDNESYWTFNADFHYDFPTHSTTYVWLRAGL